MNPFQNITQRIEPFFSTWLTELNQFLFNITQNEIEPFYSTLLKEIEPFSRKKTQRIELFLNKKTTQRIFFKKKIDSQNSTFFFLKMTHRIEPFFFFTQRIEPFYFIKNISIELLILKITQRIESFFSWLKELNFFPVWLTELFFSNHRIELFFEYDSQKWTYFLNMTQRIEPFNFWKWLTELNLLFSWLEELSFSSNDSKNWTYFWMTQKNWTSWNDSKKWTNFFQFRLTEMNPFSLNMTQRIGLFVSWVWRNELNR